MRRDFNDPPVEFGKHECIDMTNEGRKEKNLGRTAIRIENEQRKDKGTHGRIRK